MPIEHRYKWLAISWWTVSLLFACESLLSGFSAAAELQHLDICRRQRGNASAAPTIIKAAVMDCYDPPMLDC